ncbi:MAG: hypothetical protein ACMXYC_04040, partial [Candidatus Woesearchaeota archaeon]
DSGYGVSRLLEERNMANKPITSLCGHFHSGLYSIKGQQLNLRGSPGVFYGVGTTEQGDRFVDVFEVVEGAAKGIIEEYKRQGFTFQPTEDVQKAA